MKKIYFLLALAVTASASLKSQNCFVWIDSYSDATCQTSCDGTATAGAAIMPNDNPTFLWTPGNMTDATISNLCPGTYTITLTTNSCQASDVVTIGSMGATLSTASFNATCFNCADGSAAANVTGGFPPYMYSWSPGGQTTATATGLLPGTYTVYFADNSSCGVISQTVTVGYNMTTSITESGSDYGVSIHPMPVTDKAVMQINDKFFQFPYTLTIFDVTGKEIRKIENIETAEYILSREDILSGIYFFTAVSLDEKIVSGKIIIE